MSYVRTKLSKEDEEILNKIYEELEKINITTSYSSKGIPGHYHAIRTGTYNQKNARQICFGLVKYRGKFQESKFTKMYPYMIDLFKEFIASHYSDFSFRTVYVNKNTVAQKHLDKNNVRDSLLVGLGPYREGETTLYLGDEEKKFSIKTSSIIFNGSKIPHQSEKFEGTRYSLVFF